MVTNFICDNFGGIRQRTAQFTPKIITCSDMQNVELFYTGVNNGVGIRTAKGNKGLITIPNGERVVNQFQSIQNGNKYIFVHTIGQNYGTLYLYDISNNTLVPKISNLTKQTVSSGVDYKQGYDDCFVFCNKGDFLYKIQLNKSVTSYQVYYNDVIGYVSTQKNAGEKVASGTIIYSDVNLTIEYATSNGNDYIYSGYVDKEVSILSFKDAENRDIKPNFISTRNSRIFGAISNRLHACVQQNIFDWASGDTEKPTSAFYIEFSKEITAITPYLDSSLAIFFNDSSVLLSGEYPDLKTSEESPGGCASYRSLIFHGTDLYFYDNTKKGIYSFQQIVLGNKTLGKDIAEEVNDYFNKIDTSRLEDLKAISYVADDRNEIWFLLPTTDEKYSIILIYDSLRNEWIKRKIHKVYSIEVLHNTLFSGGKKIYQEYINNDFDGEFIENYYNCSPFNLGSNTSMKILYLRPRMSVTFPYVNEFWVKYSKNFDSFKKPKIKKIKSKFKNYLIWGQGSYGVNYWASGKTSSILKLPNVSAFKTLAISFYTENSKENFAIRNMEMNQIDSIQT